MCKYAYYDNNIKEDYPHLYCKITKQICPHTKKCMKVNKFILQPNYFCNIFEKQKYSNIPKGANIIELKYKNYLYIRMPNNQTIKIKDTLGLNDKEQNWCYVKKINNKYEISLEAFDEEI